MRRTRVARYNSPFLVYFAILVPFIVYSFRKLEKIHWSIDGKRVWLTKLFHSVGFYFQNGDYMFSQIEQNFLKSV